METINNLIILTTPFHKMVVKKLFPEMLHCEDSLVLYSEYVEIDDVRSKKRRLTNYNFSRSTLFKSPLKSFSATRRKFNEAKFKVNDICNEFNFSQSLNIIICSDKDIFTQLLLNKLFNSNNKRELTAIEEGLGFYVKRNSKDKLYSLIYGLLTPLLFGTRLYYVKRLGIYPKIKTIYVRSLDLLPKDISKKIEYRTFKLNEGSKTNNVVKGKCLFFSFPEQDYNMEVSIKTDLIKDIAKFAASKNKELIIKPHPREDIERISNQLNKMKNITILNKKKSGEDLDYFDYELIINFFSSIILDIVEKEYPKKKLLTIGIPQEPTINFEKGLKYCSLTNFKAENYINFDD